MTGEVAQKFFTAVLKQARGAGLLSDEHFTVDGTVIEAWASRRVGMGAVASPWRKKGS